MSTVQIFAYVAPGIVMLFAFLYALSSQQSLQKRVAQFESKLATATAGAIGMGQRIVHLEQKLQALEQSKAAVPDGDGALYTQAMQLFDSGADVNAVIANCGISKSEATLMALIRKKTAANSEATVAAEA